MKQLSAYLSIVVCIFSFDAPAEAQTSYPMVMSLKPVAAQRGQVSEHTIYSRYSLDEASQVLVSGEGVEGEVILPERKKDEKPGTRNLQQVKIRFTIAPDALPGVRDFRIATPRGVSTLGQLVVSDLPVLTEQDNNDTGKTASEVDVPATLCGAIEKAEDVDYFKFHVEEGTSLCFHVRSMRLQDRIHDLQQHVDPILTLRSAQGGTLASSDNFFRGDPFIEYQFQQSGDYLLEIRDVRYQGNRYWEYAIEVTPRPFITTTYPLAVAAGQMTELEVIGFQLADTATAVLNPQSELPDGSHWFRVGEGESQTNPFPLLVSSLPLEAESPARKQGIESAQPIALPSGINGRLESAGEVDHYRFDASKGEKWTFEIIGRRLSSPIDAHLRVLDAKGKQLQLNDDLQRGKRRFSDSLIENWTVPADGQYVIEVRDLHLRGGSAFTYFLSATRSDPYFELYADTDKTQLTPGTAGIIFVRTVRKNGFDGDVQLHVEGLPEGVVASCGRILAGKGQDGAIVLQADASAAMAVSNVRIFGTAVVANADGESSELTADAAIYQEIYQPGGGRGHWPSSMHTVNVGGPGDLLGVHVEPSEISLAPGESITLNVKIERAEGFDKNVTLDVAFKHLNSTYGNSLPEGVTLDGNRSKTLLTAGATEGQITLVAAENAPPVEKQQIAVMANVSLNFVMKATYASQPVEVSVRKP